MVKENDSFWDGVIWRTLLTIVITNVITLLRGDYMQFDEAVKYVREKKDIAKNNWLEC